MLHRSLEAAEELEKQGIRLRSWIPEHCGPMDQGDDPPIRSEKRTEPSWWKSGAGFAGVRRGDRDMLTEEASIIWTPRSSV